MCGLPGGYPDDLIDVDLDALEGPEADGVIRVSNADYLARPLRLTPTEATAIIVALRALRGSASEDTRGWSTVRCPSSGRPQPRSRRSADRPGEESPRGLDLLRLEEQLRDAAERQRQVQLTYFVPSRDGSPSGPSIRGASSPRTASATSMPGVTARRRPPVPAGPGPGGRGPRPADRDRARAPAGPGRRAVHPGQRHHPLSLSTSTRRPAGSSSTTGRGRTAARGGDLGSTCSSPTSAGSNGSQAAPGPHARVVSPAGLPGRRRPGGSNHARPCTPDRPTDLTGVPLLLSSSRP